MQTNSAPQPPQTRRIYLGDTEASARRSLPSAATVHTLSQHRQQNTARRMPVPASPSPASVPQVYHTPLALWYGAMNFSVHAVMYSYFFATSFDR